MTNKEAIDYMNALQAKCENGYEAEAIYLAIKAVKIVNLIEETFKEYPDKMMDIEDWGDVKEEIENER